MVVDSLASSQQRPGLLEDEARRTNASHHAWVFANQPGDSLKPLSSGLEREADARRSKVRHPTALLN
jgi:hypothetical protein